MIAGAKMAEDDLQETTRYNREVFEYGVSWIST